MPRVLEKYNMKDLGSARAIKILMQENASLKNALPTAHISTTSTQLTDSAEDLPIENVKLKGDTSQESTTGKNLFIPTLTNDGSNIVKANANITIENDEFVFVTTGADMYLGQIRGTGDSYVKERGILMDVTGASSVSFALTNSLFTQNFITCFDENEVSLGYYQITASSGTQNLPSGTKYVTFRFGIVSATTGTTYKTKVMVCKGNDTSFEPYTGGQASPNPDFPQLIHRVTGDCGSKFQTKNLFDKNTMGSKISRYINQPASSSIVWLKAQDSYSIAIPCKPNKKYKLWHSITTATIFRTGYITASEISDDVNSYDVYNGYMGTTETSRTIETGEGATYIVFQSNAVLMPEIIDTLQLEYGEEATSYVAGKIQNAPLSLGNEEYYEGDEIEIDYVQKAGYKKVTGARFVKNMGKMIVDNNTVFNKNDADDSNFLYYITKSDRLAGTEVLSNCLSNKTLGTLNGDNSIENVGIATISNGKLIYFNVGHYVDSNNATAVRDFLISKNAIICYKLETPITTEITDQTLLAQCETLINMKTYKEVTNIESTGADLAPVLDCDYYKSISSLEDRIEILEAQVALLEE